MLKGWPQYGEGMVQNLLSVSFSIDPLFLHTSDFFSDCWFYMSQHAPEMVIGWLLLTKQKWTQNMYGVF